MYDIQYLNLVVQSIHLNIESIMLNIPFAVQILVYFYTKVL